MGDFGFFQRWRLADAACVLMLGATSCASEESEPVATDSVVEVGEQTAALERLPAVALAPVRAEGPVVVETAVGVLEFTTLEFPAGHQFLSTVNTVHGLVATDVEEGSLRWSTDGGVTWEGITVSIDPWQVTTVDDDVVVYGDDGAARHRWDGSGWTEAARLDLTGPIDQIVFGPRGAVAVDGTTIYRSADGTHFSEADQSPRKELLGTTGSGGCDDGPRGSGLSDRLGSVLATDAGFVAFTPGYPDDWNDTPTCQPRLWFSPDGNTWQLTADDTPFGVDAHVYDTWGIAEHDGRFAVAGRVNGYQGAVWLSEDALNWQLADVDPHEAGIVASGELGWILTGGVSPTTQEMWSSHDGVTWHGPYELPSGLRSGYLPTQLTVGPDSIFGIGGRDMTPVLVTRSDDDEDGSTGSIAIAVSDLVGESGSELAGVLLSDTRAGGTAVAGFAVVVEADPFSHVETLGNVSEEWGEETADSEGWPWPSGVASVPAGTYTLRVALGNDYCCYGRWLPAASPGLRLCEVQVSTTGKDQTIEITDIPESRGEKVVCGIG